MKKIARILNVKNLYLFFIIYLFYGYFYGNIFGEYMLYSKAQNYFGIFFVVFAIVIGISPLPMYMKSKRKKTVLKTRLFFFVILCFSTVYMYILNEIYRIPKDNLIDVENKIIEDGLGFYNLGLVPTYFLTEIYQKFDKRWTLSVLGVLIFISTFILCAKEIRLLITMIVVSIKTKIERWKKERELRREIALKEEQERLEREQAFLMEEMLEKEIQEKVEEAIQSNIYEDKFELYEIDSEEDSLKIIKLKVNEDETEEIKEKIKIRKVLRKNENRRKVTLIENKETTTIEGGTVEDDTSIEIS